MTCLTTEPIELPMAMHATDFFPELFLSKPSTISTLYNNIC